jgi:prepilin-type N-terminal cleavage/methylation domain-containing protein
MQFRNRKDLMGSRKQSRGASLIEIMIALAILGIVVAGVSSFMGKQIRTSNQLKAKQTQVRLADRIRLALSDPDNIHASAVYNTGSNNQKLRSCIEDAGTCNKSALVQAAYPNPFNLYRAIKNPDGSDGAEKIAGGIMYDFDGDQCAPGDSGCVFEVSTYFWATCDFTTSNNINKARKPRTSCKISRYLNFRFMVRYIEPIGGPRGGPRIHDFPPKTKFESDFSAFAIRLRTSDVAQKFYQKCEPNQIVKGIKSDGSPICQCRNGNKVNISGTANSGSNSITKPRADVAISCGEEKCKNKYEIMIGYNTDGDIRCINQQACGDKNSSVYADCPCINTTVGNDGKGDCGAGYWMVAFEYGKCEGKTDKKGDGSTVETVTCSENKIRCCKLDI